MFNRYIIQDICGFFLKVKRGKLSMWSPERKKAFVFKDKWLADMVARVAGGEVKRKKFILW